MLDRGARDTRRRRCRRASGRLRRLASFRWPKRRHLLLPVVWDTRPRRRLAALAAERECALRNRSHRAGTPCEARTPRTIHDILRAQMREIAAAGIDTVIVSWWGPGSPEDARLTTILQAARAAGLGVAVHVEPYPGRTPADLAEPLEALAAQGVTDFYLYDSTALGRRRLGCAQCPRCGSCVCSPTRACPEKRRQAASTGSIRTTSTSTTVRPSRACAPRHAGSGSSAPRPVGPGYDAHRATGDPRVKSRADGATYDRMWRGAIRAGADLVTITSYNEWHEGTQIEPARNVGAPYASYDGAWGEHGRAAERAYLMRTAVWAQRYRAAGARP